MFWLSAQEALEDTHITTERDTRQAEAQALAV